MEGLNVGIRNAGLMHEASAPPWFHHHGQKVSLITEKQGSRYFHLGATAVQVRITPYARTADEGWYVEWEIRFALHEWTRGQIVLASDQLATAFGLQGSCERMSRELMGLYPGSVAVQGRFIRVGPFLNIPGPGTGHDGDPNVSIEIDEQMQQAIRMLLEHRAR